MIRLMQSSLFQKSSRSSLVLSWVALLACPAVWAQENKLTALSLEQLLDVTIVGASKYEQKQNQVAASASVITRDEIKTFGWRSLAEALSSLPGIHTTYDRQYSYLATRGFGLPGDLNTQRLKCPRRHLSHNWKGDSLGARRLRHWSARCARRLSIESSACTTSRSLMPKAAAFAAWRR